MAHIMFLYKTSEKSLLLFFIISFISCFLDLLMHSDLLAIQWFSTVGSWRPTKQNETQFGDPYIAKWLLYKGFSESTWPKSGSRPTCWEPPALQLYNNNNNNNNNNINKMLKIWQMIEHTFWSNEAICKHCTSLKLKVF